MGITVNVLCYKSKILSNGESPLMIRICKDGTKKYKSLGVSLNPDYWDYKKGKPKSKCPNKEIIEKLICEKKNEFSNEILVLKMENKEFTINTLFEKSSRSEKSLLVGDFIINHINRLKEEDRRGYMLSNLQLYNSIKSFNKHLNIYFSDIDNLWLRNYELWLRNKGLADNTIGIRFRTLRAIYNLAINENIVKASEYPFRAFKVAKLSSETVKRAISKDEINRVLSYEGKSFYSALSVDLFAFSYLMGGINFVDMAYLTKDAIVDNRLIYKRRKTKKVIKLPIHTKALEIIEKYNSQNRNYLFPILSNYHRTVQQRINRIHKVITKVNKHLRCIGEELGISILLTTYVARHSFATILKRSGVSTAIISESLGHSSEKVTKTYLDSFENKQMKEAIENLL